MSEPRLDPFAGKTFVITGTLTKRAKSDAQVSIEARGGRVAGAHEMRLEARDRQADEADELGHARRFNRPQTEAMASEVVADARDKRIAFGPVKGLGKEFHHPRIRVEGRKRSEVVLTPHAQPDASGLQGRTSLPSEEVALRVKERHQFALGPQPAELCQTSVLRSDEGD